MNRRRGNSCPAGSKRRWKYNGGRVSVTAAPQAYRSANGKQARVSIKIDENPMVYVGPTVEGPDAEYIKIVSGKVDVRKPSFV